MIRFQLPSLSFAALVLVGVYPLITGLSYLIEPLAFDWPIWKRTALLTPFMVGAMLYGLIPSINHIIRILSKPDLSPSLEGPKL
jgi:antibiotic biosynthesis monooxygenase (ABM) superfamily enzyme